MSEISRSLGAHVCGGELELVSEPGTFVVYGTEVPVDHLFYRCSKCGEEQVTEELAGLVQSSAARSYRNQNRFLSGGDIRAIRERLGFTQELFETVLGVGAKSMARWENDRVLQNRSVDDLLRLIDRDPACLAFLAELHGVPASALPDLPTPCAIDGSRWPRVLLAQLNSAAQRENTDLNAYLIMVLTRHLTESGLSAVSKRLDDSVRALQQYTVRQHASQPYEENWLADHQDVMRDAAAKKTKYAV